jgi:protein-tyrosine kinase
VNQTSFSRRRLEEVDGQLNAAFVAHTGLTADDLHAIRLEMQESGLSFTRAALRLGLLTQEEIEKAFVRTLNSIDGEKSSIIEAALRKVSAGRALVLRQGTEVEPGERLAPMLDLMNPRGEQLRNLRTQLLLLCETTRAAVMLAIVSPGSGEGRSQLAAELALSFAQLGKRTLLVDADLRRPRLQTLFGCQEEIGLAEAIAHETTPYLHPVKNFPQMHFLAAGRSERNNPLELLSDNRFARMMEDWRRAYTFVVIDTPPLAEYSDAVAVATLAGRVLVVSRAKQTPYKGLKEMMRRLAVTQSRVLGAVVNHF